MKKTKSILILFSLMLGLISLSNCNKDDDQPGTYSLTSLKVGNLAIDGAVSATDVVTDQPIVAVFDADVDASSLSGNISVSRGTTDVTFTTSVSGNTLTITPTGDLLTGTSYEVSLGSIKSTQGATFGGLTVSFITMGVGIDTPPQSGFQTMYIQFDGSVEDVVGDNSVVSEQISYATDRFGNANGAASFNGGSAPGNGDIVELTGSDQITSSMTISTWFYVTGTDYAGGSRILFGLSTERGYFMELGGGEVAWMKLATSHMVNPDPSNHFFGTAWTDPNGDGNVGGQVIYDYTGSISTLVINKWSHLVMTFDAATSVKTIYIDGIKLMQVQLNLDTDEWQLKDMAIADQADGTGDPISGIVPNLTLGYFCSPSNTATGWSDYSTSENTFKGLMDDFRLFNKALTESEVQALYSSEE